MKNSIVVIGMGELGSVFARGFLKLGYPVQGISRNMDINAIANEIQNPEAVLVSVGEADIHKVLKNIPTNWQDRLILIQNELLPRDWLAADLQDPTVISVWFEKKKGMDSKQVVASPVFGKHAELVQQALATLDLDSYQLETAEELTFELVRKNLYILTTNIAGLETGGDVDHLAKNHPETMDAVAKDVMTIQNNLTQQNNDFEKVKTAMLDAFAGDPAHKCMGRSAPARLTRALGIAKDAGLEVPTLQAIANKHLD